MLSTRHLVYEAPEAVDVDRSVDVHILDHGQVVRDLLFVDDVLGVTRDGDRCHQGGQQHDSGVHFGAMIQGHGRLREELGNGRLSIQNFGEPLFILRGPRKSAEVTEN